MLLFKVLVANYKIKYCIVILMYEMVQFQSPVVSRCTDMQFWNAGLFFCIFLTYPVNKVYKKNKKIIIWILQLKQLFHSTCFQSFRLFLQVNKHVVDGIVSLILLTFLLLFKDINHQCEKLFFLSLNLCTGINFLNLLYYWSLLHCSEYRKQMQNRCACHLNGCCFKLVKQHAVESGGGFIYSGFFFFLSSHYWSMRSYLSAYEHLFLYVIWYVPFNLPAAGQTVSTSHLYAFQHYTTL